MCLGDTNAGEGFGGFGADREECLSFNWTWPHSGRRLPPLSMPT